MSMFSSFKQPSTAIAIAALLVACSGGAFAAGTYHAPHLHTTTVSGDRGMATCPIGYKVTGGGFAYDPKGPGATVTGSAPVYVDPWHQAWKVESTPPVVTYAVCASVR